MAKKFKRKDSEYDVYQFKLDDNTRPDWFNEAVAAGKITLHADHAVLKPPATAAPHSNGSRLVGHHGGPRLHQHLRRQDLQARLRRKAITKELKMKQKISKLETLEYETPVTDEDIANSECANANKCMIRVSNERTLRALSGEANHHTKVDAGHITFHRDGFRFIADMPKRGKHALVQFDREEKVRKKALRAGLEFVSSVKPFRLKFKARKISKLPKNSAARKEQVNKARRLRTAGGQKPQRYTLRHRITGFA